MRTSLMFLDLAAQGAMPHIQKIAVKMPGGQMGPEAGEYSEFSELISALMAIAPEKLEASLGRMDWVKVDGELSGYAPLIDLSEDSANGYAVWEELLGQIGSDIHPLNNPTSITNGANTSWDTQTAGKIKAAIESVQKSGFPEAEMGTVQDGKWMQPVSDRIDTELNPKEVGRETIKNANGLDVDFNSPGMEGEENKPKAIVEEQLQGAKGHMTHNASKTAGADIHSNHASGQHHAGIQAAIQSNSDSKHSHAETGTRPAGESSIDIMKQGQAEGMNLNAVDSRQPNGMESIEIRSRETAPGQSFGRSLAQNDQQATKDTFTRQEAGEHGRLNPQSSHQKPEQLEILTNTTGDAEEAPLHGRHIQSDPLSSAVHRTSTGSDRGIEHLSGKSQWTPAAGEIQSGVIRQIVQRMSLRNQGSQSTMSIKLKPEFLGNLHMQVSTDNHQVIVRMATESVAVKEMIEQGLQYLKTELHHHGLEIDKFDVFVASDNDGTHHGRDTAAFQQSLKGRRQGKFGHLDSDNAGDESNQGAAVQQTTDASSEINFFV